MIGNILKSASNLIKGSSDIIDQVVTNTEEKQKLKNELSQVVLGNLNQLHEAQAKVILAEANGNLLQRSWRPVVMLCFAFIVMYTYFFQPAFFPDAENMANDLPAEFWSLLEIGLGGFVIGRTAEKIATNVTKNVDLSFLKKKDRADKLK
ncbi:3TM-type holin [Flammeovirga sp. OC4]|uniref:3TM-type holin n=1 Tax=Flammeovirga sp. OC4 TaxID=1382345 RepID=UPI0005C5282C|nr:3TM-type holin [Flammeovirga sp. OC4]